MYHSGIREVCGNAATGVLVTIDGPGGVGKSATVRETAEYLKNMGARVYTTRQPSTGTLGTYLWQHVDFYHGMALANLVAADRQYQQETEIEPRLADGNVVLCDRYLPSSLVLHGIDGVSTDTVWALNSGIRVPDAAVFLRADPATITARMHGRGGPSDRFEALPGYAEQELALFDAVTADLTARGWPVSTIDSGDLEPSGAGLKLANLVVPLLGSE